MSHVRVPVVPEELEFFRIQPIRASSRDRVEFFLHGVDHGTAVDRNYGVLGGGEEAEEHMSRDGVRLSELHTEQSNEAGDQTDETGSNAIVVDRTVHEFFVRMSHRWYHIPDILGVRSLLNS